MDGVSTLVNIILPVKWVISFWRISITLKIDRVFELMGACVRSQERDKDNKLLWLIVKAELQSPVMHHSGWPALLKLGEASSNVHAFEDMMQTWFMPIQPNEFTGHQSSYIPPLGMFVSCTMFYSAEPFATRWSLMKRVCAASYMLGAIQNTSNKLNKVNDFQLQWSYFVI